MPKRYILSISGGGIKGLLPSLFLNELSKVTRKHPTEIFDMFVGVSTGGIISLLLNSPEQYTTEDIVNFYVGKDAKKIFKKKKINLPFMLPKFPSFNIEEVLKDKLKEHELKDCIKPTVVTTYDMNSRNSLFLNSSDPKFNNIKMWEASRATASAPTFFQPFKLGDKALIDGGMISNNPSIFAVVEALKHFPHDEIVLVSLGTGSSASGVSYEKLNKWGVIDWVSNLFNIFQDGISDTTDYALSILLSKEEYFCFNPKLPSSLDRMDDVSDEYLNELVSLFKDNMLNNWRDEFNRLASEIGYKEII
jgi:patatin-like phospholipase/acyl hydrolase